MATVRERTGAINVSRESGKTLNFVNKNNQQRSDAMHAFDHLSNCCDPAHSYYERDDFTEYDPTATVGKWVLTGDGTGTVALVEEPGGILKITVNANLNDQENIERVARNFLIAKGKALYYEARVKFTEANVNEIGCAFGIFDVTPVDMVADNGAAPVGSFDGVIFFKAKGGLSVSQFVSNAAVQTSQAVKTIISGTWYRFGFIVCDKQGDDLTAVVYPVVDGIIGSTPLEILYAGLAAEGCPAFCLKSFASADALDIDYYAAGQIRL